MTDLIERLLAVEGGGDGTHWYRNPDGPEAAARIAEMEAENHALKWGPEHIGHAVGRDLLADAQARIAELEAEVARKSAALLPCPFCGGEVEVVRDHTPESVDWIRHTGRPCCVEFSNFGYYEPVAELWNRRAAGWMPRPEPGSV